MEADLAFRGIDFRDFFLPGGGPSRLSLRRLYQLILALPWESATKARFRQIEEQAHSHHLRSRRDHYALMRRQQEGVAGD